MVSQREKNKQNSIIKILNTSKKMILEGSYNATTTRRIAKSAGVSVGLIYKYFPKGKPEIAFELCKREYSDFLKKIEIPPLTMKTLPDFIREILTGFLKFHNERAPLIAALDIVFLSKEDYQLDFNETDILGMNPIPRILEELFKFEDKVRLEKLNIILLNTIESIIHRHLNYSKIFDSDDELIDYLVYLTVKTIQYKF